MKRFHFVNNEELDYSLNVICKSNNCKDLSELFEVLFCDEIEFIKFINAYCHVDVLLKRVVRCNIDNYVKIPEGVFNSMKLSHKELDTFSIAIIFRSVLIEIVECFESGGMEMWEVYKLRLIGDCENIVENDNIRNTELINLLRSSRMATLISGNIEKITFFNHNSEFLLRLRLKNY